MHLGLKTRATLHVTFRSLTSLIRGHPHTWLNFHLMDRMKGLCSVKSKNCNAKSTNQVTRNKNLHVQPGHTIFSSQLLVLSSAPSFKSMSHFLKIILPSRPAAAKPYCRDKGTVSVVKLSHLSVEFFCTCPRLMLL